MKSNFFLKEAEKAKLTAPNENDFLIIPMEKRKEVLGQKHSFPSCPILYVTRFGYIPYSTKVEIIRRKNADLLLVGGTDEISEWVAYALATLTEGKVYRMRKKVRDNLSKNKQ